MKETVNDKYHRNFQQIPLIVYVQININRAKHYPSFHTP